MTICSDNRVWSYRAGHLCCEGVELRSVAQAVGTPVYVYSYSHLVSRFEKMDRAWGRRKHLICFSIKSNPNLAVAATLVSLGAGIDVVSGGELFLALRAGVPPERIVFAGVGKVREEIREALRAGILFFTVESFPELSLINEVAREVDRVAPIALRVSPGVDPRTHRYVTTGKEENKFGMDPEAALEFYRQCENLPQVRAVGIHMHIGSQILRVRPYREGVKKLIALIARLREEGIALNYLDIGGGMGVSYRGEKPPSPMEYARALAPFLKGLKLTLVLEPGRFFAANAGCLLVRMTYLKRKARRSFLIVDGGMNDLIRPALYGSYHEIIPVEESERRFIRADVVGPVCESADFFGHARRIREPQPGDYLAVMGTGAYGYAMSSNYNSRLRPAEVLVKGSRFWVVRERETRQDLLRGQVIPDFLKSG